MKKVTATIDKSTDVPRIPPTIANVLLFGLEEFQSGEGDIDQGGRVDGKVEEIARVVPVVILVGPIETINFINIKII
jgi:hypothetical protein